MAQVSVPSEPSEQRRRVRRSALLWALIAAAFYLGFIVLTLVRGSK
jgi:predicted nucleic acid-binding Zn ribbon protein